MAPVQGIDILSTLPFIVVTLFGVIVLMLEAFQRESQTRSYLSWVATAGFVATGFVAWSLMKQSPALTFGGMNYLDGYSQVMTLLFVFAGGATALMAPGYLAAEKADRGEFYALLLLSVGGMIMMVSAADFVVFFIALEIMSIAVYALAAFTRRSQESGEAGTKYFLLGAFASALLLYGIALVYGATGSTKYEAIAAIFHGIPDTGMASGAILDALALAPEEGGSLVARNVTAGLGLGTLGVVFIVVAFGFKIAAAPFHMWAPDVYTGAPAPASGFMATAVKVASLAALYRILSVAFFHDELRTSETGWLMLVFGLAALSMIVGNIAAIVQTRVKRMLAYSSVAHAGYLLVGLVAVGYGAGKIQAGESLIFYAFAYTFATIGAFGVLAWLNRQGLRVDTYDDLKGVGYRYPWIGLVMTIFMLSSAGIPPLAGFMAKFHIFRSAIAVATSPANATMSGNAMIIGLVVLGVLASLAGTYYYLRVIVAMYMERTESTLGENTFTGARLAIVACAVLTVFVGIAPNSLMTLASRGAAEMLGRADTSYGPTVAPAQYIETGDDARYGAAEEGAGEGADEYARDGEEGVADERLPYVEEGEEFDGGDGYVIDPIPDL